MQSTSVRIDVTTHQELKLLANELHLSVGDTVRLAVRRLHQAQLGAELRADLLPAEDAWLDARLD